MTRCLPFALLIVSASALAQVSIPAKYRTATPKSTAVVAKVNGTAITAADVEPMLWNWYGKQAIEDMMSYVLVTQDAAKRGIVISDAEVDKAIHDYVLEVQKTRPGTEQDVTNFLNSQGFTTSRLYVRLKSTLLIDRIVTADFHKDRFVKVATIIVKPASASASVVADAIKRCQSAYDDLKAGKPWDTVLMSMTNDKGLIESHGVIGWRELGLFPQSAQDEMATLKLGQYTHPVQTQFGIQIFRIDARGQDASATEIAQLKSSYITAARPSYMKDLKAKSSIQLLVK